MTDLSESQIRRAYQTMLEAQATAHLGTWEFEIGVGQATWSDELYRIYGITPETYQPTFAGYLSMVHPEDRARVEEASMDGYRKRRSFSYDERIIRPDGSIRHLHTWGKPVFDENGELAQIVGVSQDVTATHQTNIEMQSTLSLLQATLESTTDGLLVVDREGKNQVFNRRFVELWGIPQAILDTGTDSLAVDFVTDLLKDPEQFRSRINDLYHAPERESFDILEFKDGRFFERYSRPQRIGDEIVGRVFSFRDVTERKKAELALQDSEMRFRKLSEATFEGVGIHHDGIIVLVNQRLCEMLGLTEEELIGTEVGAHVAPEYRSIIAANQSSGVNGPYESVGVRRDGTKFWSEVRVRSISFQGRASRVVSIRDITLRKAAELERDRLLEKEKRDRAHAVFLAQIGKALANSLDDEAPLKSVSDLVISHFADWCVIALFRENGNLRVASSATDPALADELASYPFEREDPLGLTDLFRDGEPCRYAEAGRQTILNSRSPAFRATLARLGTKSLMRVPLIIRGETIGGILIASSRPDRRYEPHDLETAAELARACAISFDNIKLYREARLSIVARDDFIAIASHELRTPLTPLVLQLELLKRLFKPIADANPAELAEPWSLLANSEQQVSRLTRLVENLLDVSRISAGQLVLHPAEVDLAEVISGIVKRYAGQIVDTKSTVHFAASGPVKGRWDRDRLEQVVVNLLTNALKYGREKPVHILLNPGDQNAVIQVIDQGIGIAPKDIGKLFQRFSRASPVHSFGGIGLGLYITRQIVEAHGGTVRVESRPGVGSTFTVTLPYARPAPAS